jgi:serine/threonine-protein kinase
MHSTPESPSARVKKEIPEALERIVLSCLAKDPADRPQSAAELARLLRAAQADVPWTSADALSFWENETRVSAVSQPASGARTIHLDLAERLPTFARGALHA